jgi:hypothetical protein
MLTRFVKQSGLVTRLRAAWRQDVEEVIKPLRKEIRRLGRDLEAVQMVLQETSQRAARGDQNAAQVKLALLLNQQQREEVARLPVLLDAERITVHVQAALAAAPIHTDPYEHIVVEGILPNDIYRLLIDALPPLPFFGERDPVKQDLPLPIEFGPLLATRVWNFVDDVVAQTVLRPAVMEKFREPLQRHYDVIFGSAFRDRAHQLPKASSGGRLMLRRPGYHLAPHRDPKRSFVTCLLYLARPGDSETYGTHLYRVHDDEEARYKQTYYPEQDGRRCERVKTVPFRPNTMLAFLNSRGAHGASIPPDASANVERYAYQFYVAPRSDMLSALIKELPRDRRTMWQNKNRVTAPADSAKEE